MKRICTLLSLLCALLLVPYQYAFAGDLQTLPLPAPFAATSNYSGYGSVRGLAFAGDDLIFSSRRTSFSGIYSVVNDTILTKIIGSGSGCSDTPSTTMSLSPLSIAAVDERQLLINDGMWSSRVWLATARYGQSVADSPINVSKAIGGSCNFTETSVFVNNSALSASFSIGPPDFSVFRQTTGELFFTQRTGIGRVLNSRVDYWFGNTNRLQRGQLSAAPVFRTQTTSNFPGQMAIDEESGVMYFPEEVGTIRQVEFGSGLATPIAGLAPLASWPPPVCNSTRPCTAGAAPAASKEALYLIYVRTMVFFRPATGSPKLYFADITLAQLFRMDLASKDVVAIAGQPLRSGKTNGNPSVSQLGAAMQMAVRGDTLYIADGEVRFINLEFARDPNRTQVPSRTCSIIQDCSGRAWNVDGLPSIGCRCECRHGWTGAQCETREPWNGITQTLTMVVETEAPPAVPVPVIKSAETTAVVTAVVVGVVANPTVATQASRSTLLLRIAKCKPDLGEELDWAQSVLKLELGPDDFRYLRGAVIGNLMVCLVAITGHAIAGYIMSRWKHSSLQKGFAIVRFPSLSAFPILLILEGTMMASMMLMIHAPSTSDHVVGAIGAVACLLLFVTGYYYLKHTFRCEFTLAPHEAASRGAPKTFREALKRFLKWLLFEAGKWENSEDGFRKRFGGFFRDYRPRRHAFMLAEFFMCIYAGALDAIQPGKGTPCTIVVTFLALGFVVFFLAIAILLPYLARLNTFLALAIAGLQAISAVQLVILVITGDPDWERASASFALASIYILAIDGLITMAELLKKILYFLWKRCWKGERWSSSSEEDASTVNSSMLLDVPMLDRGPAGNFRQFNPADDLTSLSGSNRGSFAFPNAQSQLLDNSSFMHALPTQTVIPTSSSSSDPTPPQGPRGPMEHELRRAELQALLEGGTSGTTFLTDPSVALRRNEEMGSVPSLLISASDPYAHARSGSTVPTSSSGERTSSHEISNFSFTSMNGSPQMRHSSGTVDGDSSSANASFSRRRNHLMPQLPSSSSNDSFSSGSMAGRTYLSPSANPAQPQHQQQPPSAGSGSGSRGNSSGSVGSSIPPPPPPPGASSSSGGTISPGSHNSTSSASTLGLGISTAPPSRRHTLEGKKEI